MLLCIIAWPVSSAPLFSFLKFIIYFINACVFASMRLCVPPAWRSSEEDTGDHGAVTMERREPPRGCWGLCELSQCS